MPQTKGIQVTQSSQQPNQPTQSSQLAAPWSEVTHVAQPTVLSTKPCVTILPQNNPSRGGPNTRVKVNSRRGLLLKP